VSGAPCVHIKCKPCNQAIGVAEPIARGVNITLNTNLGEIRGPMLQSARASMPETTNRRFVIGDPEHYDEPLPAMLEAWCPQCHSNRPIEGRPLAAKIAIVRNRGRDQTLWVQRTTAL
jgi:hypothetical protein